MRLAKWLVLTILVLGSAWAILLPLPKPAQGQQSAALGDPLPDADEEEVRLFRNGKIDFEQVDEPADGLGPGFNGRSCAECHSTPTTGGASSMTVVRFGRLEGDQFDPLTDLGGSLLQLFSIDPTRCQARIPDEANVLARRLTTPLFGAGLVEAIPDEDILAYAEQQPSDLRGRVHMVTDITTNTLRVGRFGWKAQQATLLAFSADAYLNEMGITSRFLPEDRAPNGDQKRLAECDRVPDPEDRLLDGLFTVDRFTNFMRFLAPPPPGAETEQVAQGREIFMALDCVICHKPSYTTGDNTSAALSKKPVNAYSDFLLHDIGTPDNIQQGEAGLREIRTAPLWGLRARGPYMHDGAEPTVEKAILRHRGQAHSARTRFQLLSTTQRQALLAFLNSL